MTPYYIQNQRVSKYRQEEYDSQTDSHDDRPGDVDVSRCRFGEVCRSCRGFILAASGGGIPHGMVLWWITSIW